MTEYYRPILQTGPDKPADALELAGGWSWFTKAARMTRDGNAATLSASELPDCVKERLCAPRSALMDLDMSVPHVMGIINATPDSFSDGGAHLDPAAALTRMQAMIADGVSIIDIGGESTRPGAETVASASEAARVGAVVAALRAVSDIPVSIDTRKASVLAEVGALMRDEGSTHRWMLNDVSAMSYDPQMAETASNEVVPVCLMHAQGDPQTMQENPRYDDVVLDVYDYLEGRIEAAVSAGIRRERIVVDPGIGFGKTLEHNIALLQNLSIFHGLGVPVLLGASRKRFIGTITGVEAADDRVAGSVAVAQHAVAQGVQIVRVHDTAETRQALAMQMALMKGAPA